MQVEKEHYFSQKYNHKARWLSYWYQIDAILRTKSRSVMEAGLGNGVARDYLVKCGLAVKTLDIDPALSPDAVGSVEKIPFPDDVFDSVLAAEILEHLPFEKLGVCLRELKRVSKKFAIISLPDARKTLINLYLKIPCLPPINLFIKIPSFKKHQFDGQHYWEIGKTDYPLGRIEDEMKKNGWKIIKSFTPADVPTKHFFILEK